MENRREYLACQQRERPQGVRKSGTVFLGPQS
jgi:hypothetical protein